MISKKETKNRVVEMRKEGIPYKGSTEELWIGDSERVHHREVSLF